MAVPKISLRAARVNAGLTQAEAAEKIGVNVATVQNWENGVSIPAWDKVLIIEKEYRWPAEAIIFLKRNFTLSEKDTQPPEQADGKDQS